jgi:hypothetical protein
MMTMTQPKPNFKRGDVVLVLFPNSDLTTAKTRPATSAIYRLIGSIPPQNVDTALKYTLNLN